MLTKGTCLTRSIELECCGRSAIYGDLEIVFFNFYHQQYSLVMRRGGGTANIIYSREGVTQGDPLAMVAYGIVIIPLIKCLQLTYPDGIQL